MKGETRESRAPYATNTVTLTLPDALYRRLQQTSDALHLSFDEVILHVLRVGSPPTWDDAPAALQAELAALDRWDDDMLWNAVHNLEPALDMERYQELLDRVAEDQLTDAETRELESLRAEADRHVLRKAHAAALLRWRGHQVPPLSPAPSAG
jgi:hypothetical protein